MHEDTSLDLRSNRIYGWEDGQSAYVVASLIEGILQNAEIPRVFVVQDNDAEDRYRLTAYYEGDNWGGHHRMLAYDLLGLELPCTVVDHELVGKLHIDVLSLHIYNRTLREPFLKPNDDLWSRISLYVETEGFGTDYRMIHQPDLRNFFHTDPEIARIIAPRLPAESYLLS